MKNRRFWFFPIFLFWIIAFLPNTLRPQMILGQYEDEAPFRTWNTFGIPSAPSLAMGETQFTLAYDCLVSLSNPALLTTLPKITFTLNSSIDTASFYRYSLVNTGPLQIDGKSSLSLLAFNFAGASVRVKNWTFALSIALTENYFRPHPDGDFYYRGYLYYSLDLDQEGNLKNTNFSIARKVFRGLSVGIGLNYTWGNLQKNIEERWTTSNITITDNKFHTFQGFFLNGGLLLDLTEDIKIALIFRTPYVKKSESEGLLRFNSPNGNTDIKIEASGNSEYKQPFVAGLGVSYKFSSKLLVASDFTFYNWSKYSITYFDDEDEIKRNFKDIFKIGLGFEYISPIRIFGIKAGIPLRAGLSYDPQPMEVPNSSYFYFSFGTGLQWGKFLLDAGMLIGKEKGSGNSLSAQKVALSMSFRL